MAAKNNKTTNARVGSSKPKSGKKPAAKKPRKSKFSPEQIESLVKFDMLSLEQSKRILKPMAWYFDPRFYGGENIPKDRGVLFVSNHSVWGLADAVVVQGAYQESGRPVRGLADRNHFKNPVTGGLLKKLGAVQGDPAICKALMQDDQNILVFPGGQREVFKKRAEIHTIVWKERVGFVRLALENDYEIVPVGVVGGDETYDIVADSGDYARTPLGKMLDDMGVFDKYLRGKDELPPLSRGVAGTLMPKPARVYVTFGKPIKLPAQAKGSDNKKVLLKARKIVEDGVRDAIEASKKARVEDPNPEGFIRKLWQAI